MNLALKVPPPIVAVAIGTLMWAIARLVPGATITNPLAGYVAIAFAAVGVAIAASGVVALHRAHTTINPMKPETSAALVDRGIYRYTRNPMYLGLLCVLIAWTIWLSNVLAWIGPIAFILYMNRFQIGPEERALAARFGSQFSDYCARVRRWL